MASLSYPIIWITLVLTGTFWKNNINSGSVLLQSFCNMVGMPVCFAVFGPGLAWWGWSTVILRHLLLFVFCFSAVCLIKGERCRELFFKDLFHAPWKSSEQLNEKFAVHNPEKVKIVSFWHMFLILSLKHKHNNK